MIRLIISALCLGLFIWNPYPFKLLELKTYDWLIMSQPEVQNENVILVDIDEAVIEAYGGYPLPRSFYADFLKRTNVAGITVLMPDPDIRDRNNDFELASVMASKPTVLASAASIQSEELSLHVGTAKTMAISIPRNFTYRVYSGVKRKGVRGSNRYAGNRRGYSSYSPSRKRRVKTLPKLRTRTLKSRVRPSFVPAKNNTRGY